MRSAVLLVVVLVGVQMVSAMDLFSEYENSGIDATVGRPDAVWFRVRWINTTASTPATFYVLGNESVVIDGRIRSYHDEMVLLNDTWKEIDVSITTYAVGAYNITWGMNISNWSQSNSFIIWATGNDTDLEVEGVNESEFGKSRERYGSDGVNIVRQRLLNRTLSVANQENKTPVVVQPPPSPPKVVEQKPAEEKVQEVTPVVQQQVPPPVRRRQQLEAAQVAQKVNNTPQTVVQDGIRGSKEFMSVCLAFGGLSAVLLVGILLVWREMV